MESTPCPLITPMVEFQLGLLEKTRRRMLEIAAGLTPEQLRRIPPHFHNNILWNLGHVVVTQQILCYQKSGLLLRIPVYLAPLFGKGTSPAQWTGQIDAAEITFWLTESLVLLRRDLEAHVFKTYEPYETSAGVRLAGIGDALGFVPWHESQHLGMILSLRKLV